MDWSSRGTWSRARWLRLGWTLSRRRRRPATAEPEWWPQFERDFWADVSAEAEVTETLHSLDRQGGRLPLVVVVATDRRGHVVELAACDPEDYDD